MLWKYGRCRMILEVTVLKTNHANQASGPHGSANFIVLVKAVLAIIEKLNNWEPVNRAEKQIVLQKAN